MSNLDKVAEIWRDVDEAYVRIGGGLSKADFLRKLLGNGNFDDVRNLLGKLSKDVLDGEDSVEFSSLQKVLLSMENLYDQIPDDLESINSFVLSSLSAKPVVRDFEKFLSLVSVAQPVRAKRIDFGLSESGMDVVDKSGASVLEKAGKDFVVFKNRSDIASFESDGSEFHSFILKNLGEGSQKFSLVFVKDESLLENKSVVEDGEKKYLTFCGVSADLFVFGG
jgi:hypothetical protein